MKHTELEILENAIRTWGKQAQLLMVLEEMSELQKEILKNINRGKDNIPELIDETTDMEIMLTQLKMIYGINEAVKKHRADKLDKIEERLPWTSC